MSLNSEIPRITQLLNSLVPTRGGTLRAMADPFHCLLCECDEVNCACAVRDYCCLCQGSDDIRLCQDGLWYCRTCREACELTAQY